MQDLKREDERKEQKEETPQRRRDLDSRQRGYTTRDIHPANRRDGYETR